jgi:RNA methyltransferase, TrmH family
MGMLLSNVNPFWKKSVINPAYNPNMSTNTISSRQNSKIKQARSLRERNAREKDGLFLVEGIRHVGEAVEAGYPLEHIICAPDLLRSEFAGEIIKQADTRGVPIYETSPDIFNTLAEKAGPQGIIAVARQRAMPLVALTPDTHPWLVAVVTPQDPGNIGTILRTIDAAGANGLILLDGGADPWHPTAVRASMGALFWLPAVQASWDVFVAWARPYHLYGTSAHGLVDYREAKNYTRPCILLLGSEREGLSPGQANACEFIVRLPMAGRGSSLNLAVAAGVVLFEMNRE